MFRHGDSFAAVLGATQVEGGALHGTHGAEINHGVHGGFLPPPPNVALDPYVRRRVNHLRIHEEPSRGGVESERFRQW